MTVKDRVLVIAQPPPEVGNLTRGTDYTTAADNARALGASAVVSIVSYQRLAAWTRLRETEERGKLEIDRLPENDESRPFILAGPAPRVGALPRREARCDEDHDPRRGRRGRPVLCVQGRQDRAHSHDRVDPRRGHRERRRNHRGLRPDAAARVRGARRSSRSPGPRVPACDRHESARGPGKDDIYNGADDDGSGVVALLQMAEAVAAGPRPKRSLLFVWHTGEEYGSWGAKYFNAFPTVPLDHVVAQLNVDMIGRSRPNGDDKPEDQVLSGPERGLHRRLATFEPGPRRHLRSGGPGVPQPGAELQVRRPG